MASGLAVLNEVANLFVVGPEALRERLRGGGVVGAAAAAAAGTAGGVELLPEELRAYVLRREDAGSVGVQTVLNSM